MADTKHGAAKLTDKEFARELFVAGYNQALDDARMALISAGLTIDARILERLGANAAGVKARAAIAKAAGGAA